MMHSGRMLDSWELSGNLVRILLICTPVSVFHESSPLAEFFSQYVSNGTPHSRTYKGIDGQMIIAQHVKIQFNNYRSV